MHMIHHYVEYQAKVTPNAVSVVDETAEISYSDLNRLSNQFAVYLSGKGIQEGAIVPILADKSIQAIAAMLGILKLGAAFVPLNPALPDQAVEAILGALDAKLLCIDAVSSHRFADNALEQFPLHKMQEVLSAYSDTNPALAFQGNLGAYLIFTSGTTGKPKGVFISHANLLATRASWQQVYQLSRSDRHLQMANMAFDVFIGDWVRALCSGGTLVLCHHDTLIQPAQLHALLTREKITVAEFVPSTLKALMTYCQLNHLDLSGFRLLLCGSDTWTMQAYRMAKQLCAENTRVINSYGLTETTIDSGYFEEGRDAILPDSAVVPIGRPFPHARYWVLDAYLNEVAPGEPGDLFIGGPGVCQGYYNRPEATEEILKDGWLATGDIAIMDENGFFKIVDRKKDMIIVSGFNVFPNEIEEVLASHAGVLEVAAVGIPHEISGEEIKVFVVLKDKSLTKDEIIAHCRKNLTNYKVPKHVEFRDELPKTNVGKILRRELR